MRKASDFRSIARDVLTGRYWWAVLASLVTAVLGGTSVQSQFAYRFDENDVQDISDKISTVVGEAPHLSAALTVLGISAGTLALLFMLALLFVGSAMELGHNRYNIALYEGTAVPSFSILFSRFSIFWRAVGLRLLIALKVFLWSLLFIVPGIIAGFRYAMAPYIMADNPDIGAAEAIERSKQMMAGNKGRLFCLHLSFIGWWLLAGLTLGIGTVFLAPYVKAAETAFYMERSGRLPQPGADPAQPGASTEQQASEPSDHAEMI